MAGSDLHRELLERDEDVVAATRQELDITDGQAVDALVAEVRPSIIVNCAAFTRVDDCETNENLANAINGSAVEFLAHAANRVDALLVQISTDFVFDGNSRTPYEVNDVPAPLSAYGRSKLIGEHSAEVAKAHLIVRTSWLFGANGPNFVAAIRHQIRKGTNPLRVVNDQRGRPTYTPHLAQAIIRLAQLAAADAGARGVVHYADAPDCTWHDFACAIVEASGEETRVNPVTTDEFPRPARRPAYSVLSTNRYEHLTGVKPESWRDGVGASLFAF